MDDSTELIEDSARSFQGLSREAQFLQFSVAVIWIFRAIINLRPVEEEKGEADISPDFQVDFANSFHVIDLKKTYHKSLHDRFRQTVFQYLV